MYFLFSFSILVKHTRGQTHTHTHTNPTDSTISSLWISRFIFSYYNFTLPNLIAPFCTFTDCNKQLPVQKIQLLCYRIRLLEPFFVSLLPRLIMLLAQQRARRHGTFRARHCNSQKWSGEALLQLQIHTRKYVCRSTLFIVFKCTAFNCEC